MHSYEINHLKRKTPTEAGDKTRETSNSSQDVARNNDYERYDSGGRRSQNEESESLVDSQEAKQIVGKPKEQLKFRNALKEKLKVTKIPNLILKPAGGEPISFNQIYKFLNFLGTGTFGFVVSAIEKSSNETIALKVSYFIFLIFNFIFSRLWTQTKRQCIPLRKKLKYCKVCLRMRTSYNSNL